MSLESGPSTQAATPAPNLSAAALFAIMCGPFISMLDGNVINVAVADISRELHATLTQVGWTISAYLLALAASLPATAWLARRFGTRRIYVLTLAAFGIASVACALSPNVETLIGARAVQGFVGAPLVPLALSMLFVGDTRYRMPAALGLMLFLAPALGPSVGGLIIGAVGWRPIFLINVPIVAAGLLGALRLPADSLDDGAERVPFDGIGLVLLVGGVVLVTLGASELTRVGVHSQVGWPSLAGGALLLLGYGIRERMVRFPILDLSMLAHAATRVGLACCTIASIVLWAMLFVIPVYVQQTQHLSATVAGLVLLPQGVVMGLGSPLGELMIRTGRLRLTVVLGMLVLTVTTAGLFVVTASTSPWVLAAILAGRGIALALTIQPLVAGLLGNGGDVAMADSSTVFTVSQRIGASLGIAAVAAFYQARVASGNAFGDTITLLVVISSVGAAMAILLPRRTVAQPRQQGAMAEVTS
jgi:EmrB/QacA subfamily drug resistance transporter